MCPDAQIACGDKFVPLSRLLEQIYHPSQA
jgi:hypothetical protein